MLEQAFAINITKVIRTFFNAHHTQKKTCMQKKKVKPCRMSGQTIILHGLLTLAPKPLNGP